MIEITYAGIFAFISLMWIVARVICGLKRHNVNWKYEAKLLTVYICLVVIARIVYFPMHKVDGHIANLYLDFDKVFPFWMNLVPVVHMFDEYDGWLINIIGNIAMFIQLGKQCLRDLVLHLASRLRSYRFIPDAQILMI